MEPYQIIYLQPVRNYFGGVGSVKGNYFEWVRAFLKTKIVVGYVLEAFQINSKKYFGG